MRSLERTPSGVSAICSRLFFHDDEYLYLMTLSKWEICLFSYPQISARAGLKELDFIRQPNQILALAGVGLEP